MKSVIVFLIALSSASASFAQSAEHCSFRDQMNSLSVAKTEMLDVNKTHTLIEESNARLTRTGALQLFKTKTPYGNTMIWVMSVSNDTCEWGFTMNLDGVDVKSFNFSPVE